MKVEESCNRGANVELEFFRGVLREQNPCEPATGNRPSGEIAALYPCGKIMSALSARIIRSAWISHTKNADSGTKLSFAMLFTILRLTLKIYT